MAVRKRRPVCIRNTAGEIIELEPWRGPAKWLAFAMGWIDWLLYQRSPWWLNAPVRRIERYMTQRELYRDPPWPLPTLAQVLGLQSMASISIYIGKRSTERQRDSVS